MLSRFALELRKDCVRGSICRMIWGKSGKVCLFFGLSARIAAQNTTIGKNCLLIRHYLPVFGILGLVLCLGRVLA